IQETAKTAEEVTHRPTDGAALQQSPMGTPPAVGASPTKKKRVSISDIELVVDNDGNESARIYTDSEGSSHYSSISKSSHHSSRSSGSSRSSHSRGWEQDSIPTGQRPETSEGRAKLQMFLAGKARENPEMGSFSSLFETHVPKTPKSEMAINDQTISCMV
ncbi:unnamed protein product, partial [Polarella glacialis]